jgi:hypothetical protein
MNLSILPPMLASAVKTETLRHVKRLACSRLSTSHASTVEGDHGGSQSGQRNAHLSIDCRT